MRRIITVVGIAAGLLLVAAPASAFAHNKIQSPVLHAVLDGLTLAVVSAPLWTAYLWGSRRRGPLIALVAAVQVPVGVIGFVPIANPWLHGATLLTALALTALSLLAVHRPATNATAGPVEA